ncbi:MAG: hypothetical protein HFK02_04700 [Clostridia bacterium]|jgi:predicted transcriptional regulator|nr:hypothetical protein [Clostridia bacterium]
MAATAAVKQNKTAQGYSYYCGIPRGLCGVPGMSISALFLAGLLSSFSGKEDEDGNVKKFKGTRGDIHKYIGGAPATLSRSMTRLKNADYVDRKGMSSYCFKQDKLTNDKTWNVPFEITTRIFDIKDKAGDVIARRTLTRGEQLTYSYFYTKLASCTHKTTTEAVYNQIAKELGIDPTTVSAAVTTLSRIGLLYCPKNWIGVNAHRDGRVGLIKKWNWFRKEASYRNRKKKSSGKKVQEGQPATVNREKYYSDLRETATRKASEALDVALSYEQYKKLDDERKSISTLYRRAVFTNTDYAQELERKIKQLDYKSRTVLENIGIAPDSLKPEYYARCKICKDTGWKKDGKACGCFGRGSPPESDNRTTKGTEYKN